MRLALLLAEEATAAGEVPVGCVVCNASGEVIGRGRNRCMEKHDATAHAEMEAIREASAAVGDWRLDGCTLFVTLEPCPMCVGAIVHTRISNIVYGLSEPVTGCCGSVINLFEERLGHHPAIYGGVCAEESQELLNRFFKGLRTEAD